MTSGFFLIGKIPIRLGLSLIEKADFPYSDAKAGSRNQIASENRQALQSKDMDQISVVPINSAMVSPTSKGSMGFLR